MNERKQLVIILVSVTVIGAAGLLFTQAKITAGDVYVDNYKADLYLNGTLIEKIDYIINAPNAYRMLYRNLMAPLVYEGNTEKSSNSDNFTAKNYPHFELVSLSVPSGTIPYVKDSQGRTMIISNSTLFPGETSPKTSASPSSSSTESKSESQLVVDISSLANLNEVGSYKPEGYDVGTYEINNVFKLQPPLECDEEYCHLNLMLAGEHIPYNRVNIQVHDPLSYISQIFVHSNTISISKMKEQDGGNRWTLTGTSPKDSILEFEVLSKPAISHVMTAFTKEASNVKGKTLSANTLFIIFPIWDQALKVMIVLFPVILLIIYYKFGKEKSFTIPKFLSYVPTTDRKPWVVNLVFKGDPFDYDIDGFYATLLDLHRRGIIEIESRERGISNSTTTDHENNDVNPLGQRMAKADTLRIGIIHKDDVVNDAYEEQVLKFLDDNSEGGIFDTRSFRARIQHLRREATSTSDWAGSTLREMHSHMDKLIKHPDKSPANEFALGRRRYSWMIFGSCLVVSIISLLLFPGIYTPLILVFQSLPLLFASPILFGRWKGEYYKEKLQWNAFRAFLSDLASIKKYAPQDIKIWQQWLVYATALGIADNVVRALRELDVKIPEVYVDTYAYAPLFFTDVYRQTHYTPRIDNSGSSTSWGGSTGGGFGSGGGFGGGGAGAR